MASVYFFTEHKYEAQLQYPYRHLGMVVWTLNDEPFKRVGLVRDVDYWYEGTTYDKITWYAYTLTPEAFKKLEEAGVEVYRATRADVKHGIRKMNFDIWIKEEDARLRKDYEERLWNEVYEKCNMQNVLDAAQSVIPQSRIVEFLRCCVAYSN